MRMVGQTTAVEPRCRFACAPAWVHRAAPSMPAWWWPTTSAAKGAAGPLRATWESLLQFGIAGVSRTDVNAGALDEGVNPCVPGHFGQNAGRADHPVFGIGPVFRVHVGRGEVVDSKA